MQPFQAFIVSDPLESAGVRRREYPVCRLNDKSIISGRHSSTLDHVNLAGSLYADSGSTIAVTLIRSAKRGKPALPSREATKRRGESPETHRLHRDPPNLPDPLGQLTEGVGGKGGDHIVLPLPFSQSYFPCRMHCTLHMTTTLKANPTLP